MALLKRKKLIYGFSACYTSANFESITSEEFFDSLIEMGAYFIWYFHYMPVGNDASPELLPTPEQRKETYDRIRKYRATKPLFAMDFQNDAEYVGGCVAGICILTQTEMLILVSLFIILIQISGKRLCWKPFSRR